MNIRVSVVCRVNSVNWTQQYDDLFKKVDNFNRQKAERRRRGFEAFTEAMLNGELCTED
jgi:hypothetical protein